jgi:hypothetical protein
VSAYRTVVVGTDGSESSLRAVAGWLVPALLDVDHATG